MEHLFDRQNSSWLRPMQMCLKEVCIWVGIEAVDARLLPFLYGCLRGKTCCADVVVETIVMMLSRDCNPNIINAYTSKVSVELSKSSRSYERESALLFFYYGKR